MNKIVSVFIGILIAANSWALSFEEKSFSFGGSLGFSKVEALPFGAGVEFEAVYALPDAMAVGFYLGASWAEKNNVDYRFIPFGLEGFFSMEGVLEGLYAGGRIGLTKLDASPGTDSTNFSMGPSFGYGVEIAERLSIGPRFNWTWVFAKHTYYLYDLFASAHYKFD